MRGASLMNYVLGTYTAIDMDTGNPATNVRYGKHLFILVWQF
jgi:desmoglein 4